MNREGGVGVEHFGNIADPAHLNYPEIIDLFPGMEGVAPAQPPQQVPAMAAAYVEQLNRFQHFAGIGQVGGDEWHGQQVLNGGAFGRAFAYGQDQPYGNVFNGNPAGQQNQFQFQLPELNGQDQHGMDEAMQYPDVNQFLHQNPFYDQAQQQVMPHQQFQGVPQPREMGQFIAPGQAGQNFYGYDQPQHFPMFGGGIQFQGGQFQQAPYYDGQVGMNAFGANQQLPVIPPIIENGANLVPNPAQAEGIQIAPQGLDNLQPPFGNFINHNVDWNNFDWNANQGGNFDGMGNHNFQGYQENGDGEAGQQGGPQAGNAPPQDGMEVQENAVENAEPPQYAGQDQPDNADEAGENDDNPPPPPRRPWTEQQLIDIQRYMFQADPMPTILPHPIVSFQPNGEVDPYRGLNARKLLIDSFGKVSYKELLQMFASNPLRRIPLADGKHFLIMDISRRYFLVEFHEFRIRMAVCPYDKQCFSGGGYLCRHMRAEYCLHEDDYPFCVAAA